MHANCESAVSRPGGERDVPVHDPQHRERCNMGAVGADACIDPMQGLVHRDTTITRGERAAAIAGLVVRLRRGHGTSNGSEDLRVTRALQHDPCVHRSGFFDGTKIPADRKRVNHLFGGRKRHRGA